MSLFPAYALDNTSNDDSSLGEEWSVSAAQECQLLASDEEPPVKKRSRTVPSAPHPEQHFYLDTQKDQSNLRVSTLYYPGRPDYNAKSVPLGGCMERRRRSRRRYWQAGAGDAAAGGESPSARAPSLRAELVRQPQDEELWLRYIEHQREWGVRGAELEAASEACAALSSPRLRQALHSAREEYLTAEQLRAALRDDIAAEKRGDVRLELWTRLVEALGATGCLAGAAAALVHLASEPAAYPRLIYAYGCVLRAAGLWEQLVLAVELTAAMSFPPNAAFPPPTDEESERRREEALQRREDEACSSGLPLNVVWARVERLRGAAHWRPARHATDSDPQRAPAAAESAELLRPVRGERAAAALAVTLLRLAKVPLPGSERCAAAAGWEGRTGESALAESLAVLVRAARRLPPAHPARPSAPAAARAALAPLLDPPHYFSDADGYLSWTNALWDACCGWAEGWRRLALVCWRLRWLHALVRLAEPAEARRLRSEARAAIKRHAPAAPVAFAHFARLEADVTGAEAGARAADHAVRAALRERDAPPEHALFAARVLAELAQGSEGAARARQALCCAVLGRPLPPDGDEPHSAPSADSVAAALDRCAERCAEIEAGAERGGREDEVCAALVPGPGEWAAARAALASPVERARLLARLLATRHLYRGAAGEALQYGEQAACALAMHAAGAARAAAARALLPAFPRNALLALVCGGAPLWAGAVPEREARAVLAALLPRLLRAPLALDADPAEAGRVASACVRAARRGAGAAGGGALLAALRVEAEARARGAQTRTARALYAALDAHADHKWIYVRGAAWCGAESAALCDAVLERGLRLHTLLDELPSASAAPSAASAPSSLRDEPHAPV